MLNIKAAKKHFATEDPVMKGLLEASLQAARPITFPIARPPEEYFGNIVRSIVSQQISVKAAAAINGRVQALLGETNPETVAKVDFETLKACGLSEKKTQYLKHNAEVWHQIPCENFVLMEDQEVIAELTKLYGIGKWTAEMFLIFSLARPNVFSYGDLGLMNSLYKNYNYKKHYHRKVENAVENWSPFKTVASLTLWHQLDNEPVIL